MRTNSPFAPNRRVRLQWPRCKQGRNPPRTTRAVPATHGRRLGDWLITSRGEGFKLLVPTPRFIIQSRLPSG